MHPRALIYLERAGLGATEFLGLLSALRRRARALPPGAERDEALEHGRALSALVDPAPRSVDDLMRAVEVAHLLTGFLFDPAELPGRPTCERCPPAGRLVLRPAGADRASCFTCGGDLGEVPHVAPARRRRGTSA